MTVHDVLGVGIGPFNLGLAALLDDAETNLDAVFLEQRPEFNWHSGMLVEGTTLEVPFMADLVTMADPTNRHSYLNFLRERDRLFEFYFYEEFFIPRRGYNDYCRWVADRLDALRFDQRVTSVRERGDTFVVESVHPDTGTRTEYEARNLVVGIGTEPSVPDPLGEHLGPDVFHSSSYLDRRDRCLDADAVTVVGSGQSAAEVFRDLVERQPDADYSLDWITRSRGFFQMVDGKLGHMVYTPDYIDYFYDLPQETKDDLLADQDLLYKGIDEQTSAKVYDALYEQSIGDADPDVGLLAATEVLDVEEPNGHGSTRQLVCEQWQEEERFVHDTEVVVLATGYSWPELSFLDPIEDCIERGGDDRLQVARDYRLVADGLPGDVFVQNAELHTHGINAPDLGLGPYRNAEIINELVGQTVYPAGRGSTFQSFAVEDFVENRSARRARIRPPSEE